MNFSTILSKIHKKLVQKLKLNQSLSKQAPSSQNSVVDPLTQKIYSRSDDMSLSMLEEVYYNVVLKQNFYDQDYGSEWNITPYEKLAQILTTTFSPKHHVDLGCGIGLLVQAMRKIGINSYGIDFSESLINKADKATQKYLTIATAEDWIQKAYLNKVDLITFTEVFEHLPVSVLENILKLLHRDYQKKIFLTIPSFGFDSIFKSGISVENDNLTWQRDMMENIPFKNIVLENGVPHHGHITLSSYRWWTEFFLFHGWSRNRDLEEKCLESSQKTLKLYNWNPYIIEKALRGNEIQIGIKTGASLGTGWHKYYPQENLDGRWSDGLAKVYFFEPEFNQTTLRLTLSAPDINYIQEWNLLITLENLVRNREYKFKWNTHFISLWHEISSRSKKTTIEFNLSQKTFDTSSDAEIASDCWRINIISPSFSPAEYGISQDSRRLGIVVHSIELL